MTLHRLLLACAALVLLLRAAPAAAQLRNRSISAEAGLSTPLGPPAPASAAFAVTATGWLEGDLEALARVALRAGPRTGGRDADGLAWSGTAGLRLSLLPEPFRPQVALEVGWARVDGPAGPSDRLAWAAGLGVEGFGARDLSVAARCALRGAGSAPSLEVTVGVAAYF
jgi:hypothetical protein